MPIIENINVALILDIKTTFPVKIIAKMIDIKKAFNSLSL